MKNKFFCHLGQFLLTRCHLVRHCNNDGTPKPLILNASLISPYESIMFRLLALCLFMISINKSVFIGVQVYRGPRVFLVLGLPRGIVTRIGKREEKKKKKRKKKVRVNLTYVGLWLSLVHVTLTLPFKLWYCIPDCIIDLTILHKVIRLDYHCIHTIT